MKYKFFSVASDILVLRKKGRVLELLLIQRKNAPFKKPGLYLADSSTETKMLLPRRGES